MTIRIKRIALLLAAVMVFTAVFAACGNTPDETTGTFAPQETTAAVDGTDETEVGDTDATGESIEASETVVNGGDETTVADTSDSTDTDSEESSSSETVKDSSETSCETTELASETTDGDTDERVTEGTVSEEDKHKVDRFNKEYAPVLYLGPDYIAEAAKPYEWGENGSYMLGGYLSEDKSYVTLIPFDGEPESLFYLFQESTKVAPIMVIKYRTRISGFYMEFFMSSYNTQAASGSSFNVGGLRSDGEWDVKIIDLRERLGGNFDGETLKHIRFDFANGSPIPEMCELDVEYIGFFNSVEDAQKFEYGEDYLPPVAEDPTDENAKLYFGATDIYSAVGNYETKNLSESLLSGDLTYVTLKPKAGAGPDGYINLLMSEKKAASYIAVKYRTEDLGYWIEFFMDSVNSKATGGSNFSFYPINDGEWHIFVLNVKEKLGEDIFNGETVNYIRFDFMNRNQGETFGDWSLDIEYIAFYETETEAMGKDYDPDAPVNLFDAEYIKGAIYEKNTRVESAVLSDDKSYVTVNMASGSVDAYAYLFTSKREAGRYMVVKYRTTSSGFYSILWMSSNAYTAGDGKTYIENIQTNGEWQYYLIDINEKLGDKFNGDYLAHFRFDFIHMGGDQAATADKSIDVGYVAFFDSMEAAEKYAGIVEEPEGGGDQGGDGEGDGQLPEETAHFMAEDIAELAKSAYNKNVASATLSEDGQFVTITAKSGGDRDGYIHLMTTPKRVLPYIAIKYRTSDEGYWIEFFMDSVNSEATAGSNFTFYPTTDGQWQICVINVVDKLGEAKFNGQVANYIRFDFMNCSGTLGAWSIDVSTIGFYDSEEAALEDLG